METTIVLVRHGETDWNLEGRVQGHTDRPLNATGLAQARELAAALAEEPLDAIYASDLSRAFETARILAQPHELDVVAAPGLREKHFGTWEGLTGDEVLERYPRAAGGSWGDAETSAELGERVRATLTEIAARHEGRRVLVVSHGGPMRAALRWCAGQWSGPIPNCCAFRFALRDGRPELLL